MSNSMVNFTEMALKRMNFGIWWTKNKQDIITVNYSDKGFTKGKRLSEIKNYVNIKNTKLDWHISIIIFVRNYNMKENFLVREILLTGKNINEQHMYNIVEEQIKDAASDKEINLDVDTVVNIGFFAFPYEVEVHPIHISMFSEIMGVMRFAAPWQQKRIDEDKRRKQEVTAINKSKRKTFNELGE